MKNRFWLALALSCEMSYAWAQAPCQQFQYPLFFSDSLSGAPLFCASNLQPYCSTTAGYTTTIPGVDTLDNGQWFRFETC